MTQDPQGPAEREPEQNDAEQNESGQHIADHSSPEQSEAVDNRPAQGESADTEPAEGATAPLPAADAEVEATQSLPEQSSASQSSAEPAAEEFAATAQHSQLHPDQSPQRDSGQDPESASEQASEQTSEQAWEQTSQPASEQGAQTAGWGAPGQQPPQQPSREFFDQQTVESYAAAQGAAGQHPQAPGVAGQHDAAQQHTPQHQAPQQQTAHYQGAPGQYQAAYAGQPGQYPPQPPAYSGGQPAEPKKKEKGRRGIGCGAFGAGLVVAALLGSGLALGGYALLSDDTEETAESGADIEINSPEDATQVSAAAGKASPSVVTLSVAGQGGQGSGSGIVLDDEGHVLTNTHVVTLGGVEEDPEIQVQLADGGVTTAEVVGTDPLSDLAVIQLEDTDDLTPAELGSSEDLNVGDETIAIGAPLNLAGTVTTGIVSTLDRTIEVASAAVEPDEIEPDEDFFDEPEEEEEQQPEDEEGFEFFFPDQEQDPGQGSVYLNVIQTDAAINQGNSGGALVDAEGNVIGVNVAIASAGGEDMFGGQEGGGGSIGVGFAIPIDYAQRVADDLIQDGEASHGLLGVQVLPASPDEDVNQDLLGMQPGDQPPAGGAFSAGGLVTSVSENSPAGEAGIQEGDVIEEVEGRSIEDGSSLTATVREFGDGETITLTVLRDGEQEDIEVTLTGM